MSSTATAPRTPGKSSEVWNYLTKDGVTTILCKLCPKRLRRGGKSNQSTNNLWTHLMRHHEDVYVTTDHFKVGGANGKLWRIKRTSASKAQRASVTSSDSQAADNLGATVALASPPRDEETAGVNGGQVEAPLVTEEQAGVPRADVEMDVVTEPLPLPQFPLELMLEAQALMPRPIRHPVPIPVQLPAPSLSNNPLVDASGRAIILRLRQLHEKDAKLFLRAQHEIGNAIFKYEVGDL